jgi:hypothetical protein
MYSWLSDEREEPDRHATIAGDNGDPIPFSSYEFARRSRRFFDLLFSHRAEDPLELDSTFQRGSVIQFLNACQGKPFELTAANALEIDLLCISWQADKAIHRRVHSFIEGHRDGPSLVISQLLFRLAREMETSEIERRLRRSLVDFVADPQLLRVPIPVMSRVVDFDALLDKPDAFQRLFAFALKYVTEHGPPASRIFRTCDMTRLTRENLADLAAVPGFQWGFVNQSVGMTVSALMEAASRCEAKLAIHEKAVSELKGLIEDDKKNMLLSVAKIEAELQSMKQQQEVERGEFKRDWQQQQSAIEALQNTVQQQQSEIENLRKQSQEQQGDLQTQFLQLHDMNGVWARRMKDSEKLKRIADVWKTFCNQFGSLAPNWPFYFVHALSWGNPNGWKGQDNVLLNDSYAYVSEEDKFAASVVKAAISGSSGDCRKCPGSYRPVQNEISIAIPLSYCIIMRLPRGLPLDTTLLAFTRGLKTDGRWHSEYGLYGKAGGLVVFCDGHVKWFDGSAPACFLRWDRSGYSADIREAVPSTAFITGGHEMKTGITEDGFELIIRHHGTGGQ